MPESTVNHDRRSAPKQLKISGYGMIVIDKRLDDLALEAIARIDIRGKILASPRIRERFTGSR